MVGGQGLTVDLDGFGIDEAGKTFDHVNVILTQHVVIRGVNAVDIGGTAGNQRIPVEFIDRGVKPVVRAVQVDRFTDLCSMPHHFSGRNRR